MVNDLPGLRPVVRASELDLHSLCEPRPCPCPAWGPRAVRICQCRPLPRGPNPSLCPLLRPQPLALDGIAPATPASGPWKVLGRCPVATVSFLEGSAKPGRFCSQAEAPTSQAQGLASRPASSLVPSQPRLAGRGARGREEVCAPAAPGEGSVGFWLHECLGCFVCLFSSKFRFQIGALMLSGTQSTSNRGQARLCPDKPSPTPPYPQ